MRTDFHDELQETDGPLYHLLLSHGFVKKRWQATAVLVVVFLFFLTYLYAILLGEWTERKIHRLTTTCLEDLTEEQLAQVRPETLEMIPPCEALGR